MDPAPPGSTITLRTLDTGEERDIHVEAVVIRQLGWFADGTALVAPGLDAGRKPSVFRIDVRNGAVTTLAQRTAQSFYQAFVTRDGQTLVYLTYANDGQMMGVRDLQSGQERIILGSGYWPMAMGLSPDGRHVAVAAAEGPGEDDPQSLIVIPVSGGTPRTLHRVEKPRSFLRFAAWTPDGTGILCGIARQATGPQERETIEYSGRSRGRR